MRARPAVVPHRLAGHDCGQCSFAAPSRRPLAPSRRPLGGTPGLSPARSARATPAEEGRSSCAAATGDWPEIRRRCRSRSRDTDTRQGEWLRLASPVRTTSVHRRQRSTSIDTSAVGGPSSTATGAARSPRDRSASSLDGGLFTSPGNTSPSLGIAVCSPSVTGVGLYVPSGEVRSLPGGQLGIPLLAGCLVAPDPDVDAARARVDRRRPDAEARAGNVVGALHRLARIQ